ncbi:hypothetical protein KP509_21G046800 [Ceratopteris richardii]|nr:hypothetical protein KP509_21G046800 [Ceratopteris richardii]
MIDLYQMDKENCQRTIETFIELLKSCIDNHALDQGRHIHSYLIGENLLTNSSIENHLVDMYARCAKINDACYTFHAMVEHDVASWNAIISGFCLLKDAEEAFNYFSCMLKEGSHPNTVTYLNILKLCAITCSFTYGTQVHAHIIRSENDVEVPVGNGLIDMYANCGSLEDASKVFYGMSERDIVSWNMLIGCHAKGAQHKESINLFWKLVQKGVRPNRITFLAVIKACAGLGCLDIGKQVHDFLLTYKMESVLYIGSALIDMYTKCGCPELARKLFDKLPERNVVVWTAMIAGYVQHGDNEEALKLFWQMQHERVCANEVTLVTILKACCSASVLLSGKRIHALIKERKLDSSHLFQCCLVDMYSKCGSIEDALHICDVMSVQEPVLWNGMIAGCITYGHFKESLALFLEMEQRGVETNEVTFVSVLKACTSLRMIGFATQIHLRIMELKADQNRILNNTLVDLYHKCGDINGAFRVFENLSQRDVVSWNIVMAGHISCERLEESVALYRQMQQEGVQPDGVTYLSMFLACGGLGALELGQQFHACFHGGFDEPDTSILNTQIDMYAKCGSIQRSIDVFKILPNCTSVSWNIIITGCAQHGYTKEAFQFFEKMQQEEVRIDNITFIAIISACSHGGLLAEGCYYFAFLTQIYGIVPSEEVFASMVDLLGKAGYLEPAKVFMEDIGGASYPVVWKALLSACRIHGDFKLAKVAADYAVCLEPEDPAAFVLWSNICAETGDHGI